MNSYAASKILVTGGSGFIGSALCKRLCDLGADVHSISRQTRSATVPGVTWWYGDLGDYETVKELFRSLKPDIVFHLASEVTGSRDLKLVLPTFNANLLSTVNMLVASTECGCQRIVMAGSLEEPDGEENNDPPSSPYAAAKWSATGYARMFNALYGTPVVTARLFMVYGPGQMDLRKLVPYVTLSLIKKEPPKLSSGQRPVDWVYVEDIVNGLLIMGQAPAIDGCTIDLGSGELTTTRKVVEMLVEVMEAGVQPEFGVLPDRVMERIRSADIARTYKFLGWAPDTPLRKGLEKTVLWYQHQLELGNLQT